MNLGENCQRNKKAASRQPKAFGLVGARIGGSPMAGCERLICGPASQSSTHAGCPKFALGHEAAGPITSLVPCCRPPLQEASSICRRVASPAHPSVGGFS